MRTVSFAPSEPIATAESDKDQSTDALNNAKHNGRKK